MYRLVQGLFAVSSIFVSLKGYQLVTENLTSTQSKIRLVQAYRPVTKIDSSLRRQQHILPVKEEPIGNTIKVSASSDVLVSNQSDYKPFVGICHGHTGNPDGYDDGQWSVKSWAEFCHRKHLSFLFLTPHASEINNPIKEINAAFHYKGKTGYQNFVNDCKKYSDASLTIIPSVEFGDAKDGNSHFLVLGIDDAKVFEQGLKIYNEQGQKATIAYFNDFSISEPQKKNKVYHYYPVVAAHPDFAYRHFDPSKKITSETDYRFNFSQVDTYYGGLNGLELLNNGNVLGDTLEDNLGHVIQKVFSGGEPRFLTGGCDFHTDLAEKMAVINDAGIFKPKPFPSALKRQTIIWAKSNSQEDLMDGLMHGQSAALYANLGDFDTSHLPQNFLFDGEKLGSLPVTQEPYHMVREFKLSNSFPVKYCWYKITQHYIDPYSPTGYRSITRLPASGYYQDKNEQIVLDDQLNQANQYYILVVKSQNFSLVMKSEDYHDSNFSYKRG